MIEQSEAQAADPANEAHQKILDQAMANAARDVRKLERQRQKFKLHVMNPHKPVAVGDEMRGQWDGFVWRAKVAKLERNEAGEITSIVATTPERMGKFTTGPNRRDKRRAAALKRQGREA